MTTLFLSYARGDDGEPFDPRSSFVGRLHRDLMARGFTVWFDHESMPSRNLTFHQEIRDAVAACDRLVLVVGPKMAISDYVWQEWQFAYFEADKVVTPILRQGDFPLVPDELKLLHCEDFRDDAQYAFHEAMLARHQLARFYAPYFIRGDGDSLMYAHQSGVRHRSESRCHLQRKAITVEPCGRLAVPFGGLGGLFQVQIDQGEEEFLNGRPVLGTERQPSAGIEAKTPH